MTFTTPCRHFMGGATALATVLLILSAPVPAVAQDGDEINPEGLPSPFAPRPYSPYANRSFPTEVLFGDTHVYTSLSADAGGGTVLLPRDACS